jgi:WD40 repeat protein
VAATFSLGSSDVLGAAGWSSDGKYLAAHAFNTQGDPLAANDTVIVWDVATQQTIFKKTLLLTGSNALTYWQPQSHNLAFYSSSMANQTFSLGIWDVLTGSELHKYAGQGSGVLAFSPDGQQMAYNTYIGTAPHGSPAAAITDIDNGTHVFTYKGSNGPLAWSPDGKYIVSAFNGQLVLDKKGMPIVKNGQMETTPSYAKVWVA